MTASLDLKKLLREMDKAFIQREPLPDHFIKPLDQHTRETYAAMLAAIMLADGNLQENQSRLFSLLCTALGLSDGQINALHQATQISSEHIVDFCRLAEEQNFAVSFLADSLILSRIDSPITHNQNQLLNQWCMLLRLPNSHIETAVVAAANTLGIATNLSVDGDISINQFKVWSECIYRPINVNDCTQGKLNAGYWLINQNITFDEAINLKNQTFKFTDGATFTFNNAFELINCNLIQPLISANIRTKNSQICKVESNSFTGNYNSANLSSMMQIHFSTIENDKFFQLLIKDNSFETINARAIKLSSFDCNPHYRHRVTEILFTNNQFKNCGNEHLPGGAICISNSALNYKIDHSSFTNCKGFIGGALYVFLDTFYENFSNEESVALENCQFTNCVSYYSHPKNNSEGKEVSALCGGGIWVINEFHKSVIAHCHFENASIRFGRVNYHDTYFKYCTFQKSMIAYELWNGIRLGTNCEPNPDSISIESKKWYSRHPTYKKPESFTQFIYPMPVIWETSVLK